jgi:CYTH domain-containing protein
MANVDLVAIDGGPCGGKTTGIVHLSDALIAAGMVPLVVPEAATLLIRGGVPPWQLERRSFQECVNSVQFAHEEVWLRAAKELSDKFDKRAVVLCDRGLPSSIAYIEGAHPVTEFEEIVKPLGFPSAESVFSRYTGVLHFATAADGAEEYYSLANNIARTETAEEARALDVRTKSAWLAHSHLHEIANRTPSGTLIGFEEKMRNATAALFHMLGIPVPIEIEDKFLLRSFSADHLPVPHEKVFITQTYLLALHKKETERVRKRVWRDGVSYIHTIKEPNRGGGRIERERFISHYEYCTLLGRADPRRRAIEKIRHCFLWAAQYFEVDVFTNLSRPLILCEREKTTICEETILPPFLNVERNVTNEREFSNSSIALKF